MQKEYTVETWAREWFRGGAGRWRPGTEGGYRNLIERHIVPGVGSVKLNALKPVHVNRFYAKLAEKGLSAKSVWCVHLLLRRILDAAEELGYLPMFALMLTADLRQRELIALKWSDFDEKRSIITLSDGRSLVKGRLVEYGGGTHEVALPPETASLLRQEHDKHPSAELLFIHSGTRKPYLPTMLRLIHQRILDKAGLELCRFEDLRHTAAVRMLDKDGDVKAMSTQLGHSCLAMTKLLYADYLPVKKENAQAAEAKETTNAELQKAADTLGAMLRF